MLKTCVAYHPGSKEQKCLLLMGNQERSERQEHVQSSCNDEQFIHLQLPCPSLATAL